MHDGDDPRGTTRGVAKRSLTRALCLPLKQSGSDGLQSRPRRSPP